MNRNVLSPLGALLLCSILGAAELAANELHPEVPLLDASGRPVLLSAEPLSTMQTCGECHDAVFIESSSDHADAGAAQLGSGTPRHDWAAGPGYFGSWDPLRYDLAVDGDGALSPDAWLRRYGPRHVGGGPVGDRVEMDCLMCHSDITGPGCANRRWPMAISPGPTPPAWRPAASSRGPTAPGSGTPPFPGRRHSRRRPDGHPQAAQRELRAVPWAGKRRAG
jgi:hypothetical protein